MSFMLRILILLRYEYHYYQADSSLIYGMENDAVPTPAAYRLYRYAT
jgi:hypothetical protein